ncbi:MAG TPA: sigma-70 family RNA polymerase sigma factor [Armatimonadetes bacterium]|nr:sigma-70 family RNA polymerase sigma factor [Armatimonadota bacterium]
MVTWIKRTSQPSADEVALFEELVRQYEQQMYRVAYRLTGNHEDAQDLIQDALYEAFRNFDRFEPGTRFDRWLYRIMTNRHIDRVRKQSKVTVLSLDQPQESDDGREQSWELPDEEEDPAEKVIREVLDERIQEALDELPEEYRLAVILADLEDLTYEEVSQVLGCPIGTVRSRLHRGRNLLREKLKTLYGRD